MRTPSEKIAFTIDSINYVFGGNTTHEFQTVERGQRLVFTNRPKYSNIIIKAYILLDDFMAYPDNIAAMKVVNQISSKKMNRWFTD